MCDSFRSLRLLHRRVGHAVNKNSNNGMFKRQLHNSALALNLSTKPSMETSTTRGIRNRHQATKSDTTRLFGSKRGVPGNPMGSIAIYNEQETLKDIDVAAIEQTTQRISKILGYETYDVTILLVDDEEMRETNLESRGINNPTDILSFPFHMCQENKPGLLEEPEFDIPDYYTLGDMVICVPYVIRRCKEDALFRMEQAAPDSGESNAVEDTDNEDSECEDDDSDLYEDDDRGISGAMAGVDDPERRIRMLLVHGMLHLVGYDHIEDDEYIEMVEREEELLRELGEL